jgi:hypothetical protein
MKAIFRITLAAAFVLGVAICAQAQEDATGTPLEDITHDMKVAANHLSKRTTAKPTQLSQEEAVAKLDKLIAELEKERQSMGSGSTPNPTRPATASNVRSGPGGMGDLHGTRDQGDRWGELPAHERDRILQSLTEGFPPHYQAILEAYYKRLAIEKRAEDPDAAPPPPPKATAKAAPAKSAAPAPAKSPIPAKKSAK